MFRFFKKLNASGGPAGGQPFEKVAKHVPSWPAKSLDGTHGTVDKPMSFEDYRGDTDIMALKGLMDEPL